jgi:hypothetical protein
MSELTKEQVAEIVEQATHRPQDTRALRLCDSHESLRARIAELEGNGEGSVAGANRRVGYIMGDLELARKQVAALSSQLAAAREALGAALSWGIELGTGDPEWVAKARAALDGLGEGGK